MLRSSAAMDLSTISIVIAIANGAAALMLTVLRIVDRLRKGGD
jgi:hypothetical protein